MTPPVQHMIEQEYWTGPRLPDPICLVRQQLAQTPLAFGQPMRPNFSIDFAAFVFLNHGAFGACLRLCYAEVRAWQEHCEAQPLRFIDRCGVARAFSLATVSATPAHGAS